MNNVAKSQIEALAFGVALEKAQSGAPPMSKAEFDGLCETVAMELERAVETILGGKVTAPTAKPKRAPHKPAEPASTGKRSGIEPEALNALLGLRTLSDGMSLQDLAGHFSVSKGVAERAVKALPGVKSAPGTKAAGQRGKPPTVFWVE